MRTTIKSLASGRIAMMLAGAVGGVLTMAHPAFALTRTWQNTGTDFNTAVNWGGTLPGSSDTALLPSGVSVVNPDLSGNIAVQTLSIDNSGADYSITQTGTPVLTISNSGGGITVSGGGTTNIAPEVRFAGSKIFDTGSASLNLAGGIGIITSADNFTTLTLTNSSPVLSSAITTRDGTSSNTRTVIFDGAGSMSVSGNIAPGSGLALITIQSAKSFSGTLNLSGSNTFATAISWRAGTLAFASDAALGGSNISVGTSSSGATAVNILTTAAFTTNKNISFIATTNTSITVGGSQTSGTSIYSGTLNLANLVAANNGVKVTSALGGTVEFNNVISGSTTNGPITKVGAGTVKFSGANTYQGGTTISEGTLIVSGTGTLGTGGVAVSSGAVLELDVNTAISNSATLNIATRDGSGSDKMFLNFSGNEIVGTLILGSTTYTSGLFNATTAPAYFSGSGNILVPEPSCSLLAFAGAGSIALRRRYRRR